MQSNAKRTKYAEAPHTSEQAAHMKMRQRQNLERCITSKAESWAGAHLNKTEHKWTRQAVWGWRVFDFWNHQLGIAVEIDGPEHDTLYEQKRDAKNWKVSRIRVIRVKNFDDTGMLAALEEIRCSQTWNERRSAASLSLIRT